MSRPLTSETSPAAQPAVSRPVGRRPGRVLWLAFALQAAIAAGATAVIQPGGSIGDADVIAAADAAGVAMAVTGMRHFRH